MLSYQHAYHAGGYADVVKHLILSRIIHYMQQKDKPFLYLDTHSGRGVYDIKDHFSQKTKKPTRVLLNYGRIDSLCPMNFLITSISLHP